MLSRTPPPEGPSGRSRLARLATVGVTLSLGVTLAAGCATFPTAPGKGGPTATPTPTSTPKPTPTTTPTVGPIEPLSPYIPQTSCDATEKPGVVKFEKYLHGQYPTTGSYGVINPATVWSASTPRGALGLGRQHRQPGRQGARRGSDQLAARH